MIQWIHVIIHLLKLIRHTTLSVSSYVNYGVVGSYDVSIGSLITNVPRCWILTVGGEVVHMLGQRVMRTFCILHSVVLL